MARAKHRRRRWAGRVLLPAAVVIILIVVTAVAAWAVIGGRQAAPHANKAVPRVQVQPQNDEAVAGPAPAPPPKPTNRTFTIAATGDILLHSQLWERAAQYAAGSGERYDFRPMFAKVRPALSSADLAICHMETPLSASDENLSSFPVFDVPHEIADAIAWAGYDTCSTASNHSIDQGMSGVGATLDALDEAGVAHAGTARTPQEARHITFFKVNGAKVAQLSYAYGFNGFTPQEEWEANRIQPSQIIADAKRARDRGSDFTIVSLHWGTEYINDPTVPQRQVADRLAASRFVDLIIGHHAHVVQPIDRYGPKIVVFGMGNFLSGMTTSLGHPGVDDGVIVHITVQERHRGFAVTKVAYTPTWVEPGTWRILPVAASLDSRKTPDALRPLLEASWTRTSDIIWSLGAKDWDVQPRRSPR
jgi:poly-gamma-glutamate capsule biosynthesis protein CapA/YwtB (metallophosphatase superfamily)